MFRQRICLRFSKRGELRYISHLDLIRTFERAIRRANLPIRMTGGFNPRPRMSFPLSLGVGIDADEEVIELELADWVVPAEAAERLQGQLPAGLEIGSVESVRPGKSAQVAEVVYEVRTDPEMGALASLPIEQRIESVLAQREIIAERVSRPKRRGRGAGRLRAHAAGDAGPKRVDIRPYIRDLRLEGDVLVIHIRVTPQGSAKPLEVLGALDLPLDQRGWRCQITRRKVILAPRRGIPGASA